MQQLLTYTSPEGFSPGYKLIHQTTVPCGYRCSIEGRIRPHITHSQQRVHSPLCPPCSGHSALWNKLPPQGLHLCCSFCLECSSPRYPHGFAPCLLQTFLFKCQTLLAYLKENSNCSGFFFKAHLSDHPGGQTRPAWGLCCDLMIALDFVLLRDDLFIFW